MDAIEPRTCRDLGFNLRANVQTVGRVLKSYNAEQVRVSTKTYIPIGVQLYCTAILYSCMYIALQDCRRIRGVLGGESK